MIGVVVMNRDVVTYRNNLRSMYTIYGLPTKTILITQLTTFNILTLDINIIHIMD